VKQGYNTPNLKRKQIIKHIITWWHNKYKLNRYSIKNGNHKKIVAFGISATIKREV